MKIIWSPVAVDKVSEIVGYIAQDNPVAAESWIEKVFQKVEELKVFPENSCVCRKPKVGL
jgi:toxin ParE1/3/4